MATPFVSGAAALLLSYRPRALASQVKAALLDSVDPLPDFAGKTVTGGRLNVRAALDLIDDYPTPPPPPANTVAPTTTGAAADGGTLTATPGAWDNEPTDFGYQWRRCDADGGNCQDIAGATAAGYAPTSGDRRHTLSVAVTATSPDGQATATSNATASVVGSPDNTVAPTLGGTLTAGATRHRDDRQLGLRSDLDHLRVGAVQRGPDQLRRTQRNRADLFADRRRRRPPHPRARHCDERLGLHDADGRHRHHRRSRAGELDGALAPALVAATRTPRAPRSSSRAAPGRRRRRPSLVVGSAAIRRAGGTSQARPPRLTT